MGRCVDLWRSNLTWQYSTKCMFKTVHESIPEWLHSTTSILYIYKWLIVHCTIKLYFINLNSAGICGLKGTVSLDFFLLQGQRNSGVQLRRVVDIGLSDSVSQWQRRIKKWFLVICQRFFPKVKAAFSETFSWLKFFWTLVS